MADVLGWLLMIVGVPLATWGWLVLFDRKEKKKREKEEEKKHELKAE